MLVESTEVPISIPKVDVKLPAAPIVKEDGTMFCAHHKDSKITHRCTNCHAVLCDQCVHTLRRHGGRELKLCPLCSHECTPLEVPTVATKKKQTVMGFLAKTVKMAFMRQPPEE